VVSRFTEFGSAPITGVACAVSGVCTSQLPTGAEDEFGARHLFCDEEEKESEPSDNPLVGEQLLRLDLPSDCTIPVHLVERMKSISVFEQFELLTSTLSAPTHTALLTWFKRLRPEDRSALLSQPGRWEKIVNAALQRIPGAKAEPRYPAAYPLPLPPPAPPLSQVISVPPETNLPPLVVQGGEIDVGARVPGLPDLTSFLVENHVGSPPSFTIQRFPILSTQQGPRSIQIDPTVWRTLGQFFFDLLENVITTQVGRSEHFNMGGVETEFAVHDVHTRTMGLLFGRWSRAPTSLLPLPSTLQGTSHIIS